MQSWLKTLFRVWTRDSLSELTWLVKILIHFKGIIWKLWLFAPAAAPPLPAHSSKPGAACAKNKTGLVSVPDRSRKQLLRVTITSSFWGLHSFLQLLNQYKYCTSVLLLREVAAQTHTCTHVHTHAHTCTRTSTRITSYVSSALFTVQPALLLKGNQKGIDYKKD